MSQPTPRRRKGTVSLPGRGLAASVVDEIRAGSAIVPSVAPTSSPAAPAAPAATSPANNAPAPSASAAPPPPPPKRQKPLREQFSTKLPPVLVKDLRNFADHHEAEIQVVVELALAEYLARRGWETHS